MATLASRIPIPKTPEAWLAEIAAAFRDAHETTPFFSLTGVRAAETVLSVCIRFGGISGNQRLFLRGNKGAEAAFGSALASKTPGGGAQGRNPRFGVGESAR
jgi:hypothetical protein